ncbi:maleylpyruvate isomerase family mycothiol-dependent enzyme [Amycolatopsis ultiminotia]|uniref:Maleylpyruvate isomerase family mycothiol-dependent enzyme n=1 Tax=Amycolatopsis ultiminotia TaxID=543629 RepID=A0ABP6X2T5_9PSEU
MPTLPLPALDYLPHLRALTEAFAGEVRAGSLDAAVPVCGDWTRRDLVGHLGNVHRWAAHVVATGQRQQLDDAVGADLAEWYADSAAVLLDALAEVNPGDSCWHFGGTAKTKAFWFRRQVHETAVHLIDALAARGEEPRLEPLVAADGVDEVLAGFLPRVTRFGAVPPLPVPIGFRATDLGHSWTLVPGEPPALGEAEPAATVEAQAQDLLTLLWKRSDLSAAGLRITGDEAVVRAFLTAQLTP